MVFILAQALRWEKVIKAWLDILNSALVALVLYSFQQESILDEDVYQEWSEEDEDGEATQDDFVSLSKLSSIWTQLLSVHLKLLFVYLPGKQKIPQSLPTETSIATLSLSCKHTYTSCSCEYTLSGML